MKRLELLVVFFAVQGGGIVILALFFLLSGTLGGLGLIEPHDSLQDRLGGVIGCAIVAGFLLFLGGLYIGTAIGLKRLRPWARFAGLLLAVLDCLNCCNCFFLAVGIYAFITLSSDEVASLFRPPATIVG